MQEHHRPHQPQARLHFGAVEYARGVTLGVCSHSLLDHTHLNGIGIDLGIAAQLAMHPELLMSPETEAALAQQLPPVAARLMPQVASASTAPWTAAAIAAQSFDSLSLPTAVNAAPQPAGQPSLLQWAHGGAAQPPPRPDMKATRPRPSPFLARAAAASLETGGNASARAASPAEIAQQRDTLVTLAEQQAQKQQQGEGLLVESDKEGGQGGHAEEAANTMDGSVPMSLGGLSSMQDLIDGLPSQADLTWSAILGAVAGEEVDVGAGTGASVSATTGAGASGTASELMAALPSLLLPSWAGQRPPSHPHPSPCSQSMNLQEQARVGPGQLGPHPFNSRLHNGGMLEQPPVPLRHAPDAPVHVQPPSRATSPCQATITTGTLPSLVLPSLTLASHGLLSLALPSSGLSRPELSGTGSKFMRRSHGEVSTLSPVASCGQNGEVVPCSPAPTGAGFVTADEEETCTAGTSGVTRAVGSFTKDKDVPAAMLPSGNRRTRQDVADAAAAAAADQGLDPAPGSIVERCAKRSNPQVGRPAEITADRVESLGAFLTDQQAGLRVSEVCESAGQRVAVEGLPGLSASPSARSPSDGIDKMALARQLLELLRVWSEEGPNGRDAEGTALAVAAAAEVYRRAEELLAQGAPVDATEDSEVSASGTSGTAGYTALHWACLRGDVALVELLLRHGADPERCDAAGIPARLTNPAFTATLSEVAARCAAQCIRPDPKPAPDTFLWIHLSFGPEEKGPESTNAGEDAAGSRHLSAVKHEDEGRCSFGRPLPYFQQQFRRLLELLCFSGNQLQLLMDGLGEAVRYREGSQIVIPHMKSAHVLPKPHTQRNVERNPAPAPAPAPASTPPVLVRMRSVGGCSAGQLRDIILKRYSKMGLAKRLSEATAGPGGASSGWALCVSYTAQQLALRRRPSRQKLLARAWRECTDRGDGSVPCYLDAVRLYIADASGRVLRHFPDVPSATPVSASTSGPNSGAQQTIENQQQQLQHHHHAGVTAAAPGDAAFSVGATGELQEQLQELLRQADEAAGQLMASDPAGAPAVVLQLLRETRVLYQCVVLGAGREAGGR
ncbi:hypothetical protein Vretimale_7941 [Volvox reticuliferus]|uniref:Uncharacterized protein n=1 Tax=Volvox reticuliferus TaxID=1737510 RepID=A0A8J4LND5_9CHLO|nr:hypothetical protein Vretimale_7941 [Volvox reticuliferus]